MSNMFTIRTSFPSDLHKFTCAVLQHSTLRGREVMQTEKERKKRKRKRARAQRRTAVSRRVLRTSTPTFVIASFTQSLTDLWRFLVIKYGTQNASGSVSSKSIARRYFPVQPSVHSELTVVTKSSASGTASEVDSKNSYKRRVAWRRDSALQLYKRIHIYTHTHTHTTEESMNIRR